METKKEGQNQPQAGSVCFMQLPLVKPHISGRKCAVCRANCIFAGSDWGFMQLLSVQAYICNAAGRKCINGLQLLCQIFYCFQRQIHSLGYLFVGKNLHGKQVSGVC